MSGAGLECLDMKRSTEDMSPDRSFGSQSNPFTPLRGCGCQGVWKDPNDGSNSSSGRSRCWKRPFETMEVEDKAP